MKDRMHAAGTWTLRLLALAALVLLLLYMTGALSERIRPTTIEVSASHAEPDQTATVQLQTLPLWYEAVGTVRSRTDAQIASQVTGSVTAVHVEEGASVKMGAAIVTLDSSRLQAQLEQARSAVDATAASHDEATAAHLRVRRLFERDAATQEELEAATARKKQADAGLEAARQKLAEARVALSYTRLVSPLDGVVARRDVDPGDLAWPGRPLLTIHDPTDLHLEANVREGLVGSLRAGRRVDVVITALERHVEGTIDEVAPSGDPVSRSFRVKARIAAGPPVYPGMFGKLRLRIGEREGLTVPARAITSVGQLRSVLADEDGIWVRRHVTVGDRRDGSVEVLSGLREGQRVGWSEESLR